jgi:hypothetical protein
MMASYKPPQTKPGEEDHHLEVTNKILCSKCGGPFIKECFFDLLDDRGQKLQC